MGQKLKILYDKHLSKNLGLINLFGKSFGRVLYLILIAYFSYKLKLKDFTEFAIFWSTLRMFTFFGSNNLYIVYFNDVRIHLTEKKKWPTKISSNLVFTTILFIIILSIASLLLFDGIKTTLFLISCFIACSVIRNISEFAKSDNNLFLSIFVDDVLFYLLFFILSIVGLNYRNDLNTVLYSLLVACLITAITALVMFAKKFQIKINSYKIRLKDFSFRDFKLGLNYTFIRGNEVLSNFAVRYLGQIYFGDLFVAYAHIMYQFYNIFSLLTMSVVSGFQSKITVKHYKEFSKRFYNTSYKRLLKTILPFVIILLLVLIFASEYILYWFFPKFVNFSNLLIKVGLAGLVFAFIQPFIFVLVYNNRFNNLLALNITQYLIMIALFVLPFFITGINEEYWLLMVMICLILVQGIFAWLNYKEIR